MSCYVQKMSAARLIFFIVLCYDLLQLYSLSAQSRFSSWILLSVCICFSDGLCTRRSSLHSGTSSRHANVPLT